MKSSRQRQLNPSCPAAANATSSQRTLQRLSQRLTICPTPPPPPGASPWDRGQHVVGVVGPDRRAQVLELLARRLARNRARLD
jgi:hypothetical protein